MYPSSWTPKIVTPRRYALAFVLLACGTSQAARLETDTVPHDNDAALTWAVYRSLLNSWNDARVAPRLKIVADVHRVHASSEESGEIVLSRGAIRATLSGPASHAQDRIAFVLAHELAHHRADHLRIQRWARSIDTHAKEKMGDRDIAQINQLAEWQADAEALIVMTLAGFDPFGIVNDPSFFVRWVEHAANIDCSGHQGQRTACRRAFERMEQLQAQLSELVPHAVVFEVAVQSYVAGDYPNARSLFSAFGRLFPDAAVYANLGAAYLTEAYAIRDRLLHRRFELSINQRLYYPIDLAAETRLTEAASGAGDLSRGEHLDAHEEQMKMELASLIYGAQAAFDDAARLAPGDRRILSHRIASYVVGGKINLAKGLLEEEYLNGDTPDARYHLLDGMILAARHEHGRALEAFTRSMESAAVGISNLDGQFNVMAAASNKAVVLALLGRHREIEDLWEQVTQSADVAGASALFRLSLARLQGVPVVDEQARGGGRFGDILLSSDNPLTSTATSLPLRLSNKHVRFIASGDGNYRIQDEARGVIAEWRKHPGAPKQSVGTTSGDYGRLIGLHGIPNRHVRTEGGVFLAYDAIRTGFQLRGDQLVKQFRYPTLGKLVGEH